MPPPRPIAGQASAEYVALLAVVGAVVAGAAAVGSPPALAVKLAAALRHGICRVADGVCTARQARAAGLSPCLVQARTDRERLGGRMLVVRLGRGDALLVERRSDGSAAVSFTDGASAGATVGVGLRVPSGPRVGARGGAGVQFSAGRTWEFPSFAAAARFVRRWAPRESLGGRGAQPAAPGLPALPAPRVAADARARRDLPRGWRLRRVRRGAARRQARGGRRRRARRARRGSPWAAASPATGASPGTTASTPRPPAASAPCSAPSRRAARARRRSRSRSSTAAPSSCGCAPRRAGTATSTCRAPTASLRDVAATLRGAPAPAPGGRGRRVEAEVALDLTDPANRRALAGVVDVLRLRVRPSDWDDRLRALAARLDADGAVDVRLLRVGLEERDAGAEAALGLVVGGNYRRTQEVRDLVRAWSLRAGGGLREREDCVSA